MAVLIRFDSFYCCMNHVLKAINMSFLINRWPTRWLFHVYSRVTHTRILHMAWLVQVCCHHPISRARLIISNNFRIHVKCWCLSQLCCSHHHVFLGILSLANVPNVDIQKHTHPDSVVCTMYVCVETTLINLGMPNSVVVYWINYFTSLIGRTHKTYPDVYSIL